MAFGISNFEQLPWYIQVALEDMEVRIQALLRNVQTDVLASAASSAALTLASEGRHWKSRAPWLMDDPSSATPNIVGLVPPKLLATTINNYAPQGIDDAVMLELESSVGDVTITGITPRAGGHKRLMMIRNRDSQRTITLAHANSGSVATAQFDLPSSTNVALGPKQNSWMYYDPNRDGGKWTMFVTPQQSGGLATMTNGYTVVSKSLSEAELEAGNAGIEIVAATAGKIIVPISLVVYVNTTVSYTNNPSWSLRYDNGTAPSLTSAQNFSMTGTGAVYRWFEAAAASLAADPTNVNMSFWSNAALTGSGTATGELILAYVLVDGF